MNKQMCEKFQEVRSSLPDQLNSSGYYQFKDEDFLNKYCDSNQCQSDYDRISAGCLYLLDQLYSDSGVLPSPKDSNPYIVDYILIWLSYMLNLPNSKEEDNIKVFYSSHINSCDKYKTEISELKYRDNDYDNYKGLIDKRKEFLYMDNNIVPKFYEAFKSLCNLYNELDYETKNCENYLEGDNEFDKKYKELKDYDITNSSPYKEMLSTLSTDYDDFKKECKDISSSTSKESEQSPGRIHGQTPVDSSGEDADNLVKLFAQDSESSFGQISEVTSSSSSIVSKLIPVLLIFGAIPIFLGISYKYSLFGFRKRVQKHLRKKLKK
ncbi:uncharacterized protein PY17X_1049701 [Plasmodium yoelii]|uniref:PIR protein n=2 Tax=Plasmodium yoelii TaxID=5861 RepID=A0AAF0B5G2_PLAYO|nr:uncharacterized protein PY17X_1049701 [Plasmodium yoelii]WBY58304.1 PIR protein [Plasmodium yoelii yoelii]CDU16865.1 YIR protein [Plasmodium yoelii]VTZ79221.1 PIR protein [Plasmodium yoelii]|eukprot:XP_727478.2 uncharacterized protein PY17X_1049701 [Plasmodium yoelii]